MKALHVQETKRRGNEEKGHHLVCLYLNASLLLPRLLQDSLQSISTLRGPGESEESRSSLNLNGFPRS